jgi:GMP synthase-like glutamine amidotransferase
MILERGQRRFYTCAARRNSILSRRKQDFKTNGLQFHLEVSAEESQEPTHCHSQTYPWGLFFEGYVAADPLG